VDNPKIGKLYTFARRRSDGGVDHTSFVRYADGSAMFVADGFMHPHEGNAHAWKGALEELAQLGFEEVDEAKARGTLPTTWQPSESE
jgi:hypothetical protein